MSSTLYPIQNISEYFGFFYKLILILFCSQIIFVSFAVSMTVKYAYICFLTLLAFVGGERLSKKIGWLHKYLVLVRNSGNRRHGFKLKVQLILAIIGMYALFTTGFYLLTEALELVFKQEFILNIAYVETLIETFFII